MTASKVSAINSRVSSGKPSAKHPVTLPCVALSKDAQITTAATMVTDPSAHVTGNRGRLQERAACGPRQLHALLEVASNLCHQQQLQPNVSNVSGYHVRNTLRICQRGLQKDATRTHKCARRESNPGHKHGGLV